MYVVYSHVLTFWAESWCWLSHEQLRSSDSELQRPYVLGQSRETKRLHSVELERLWNCEACATVAFERRSLLLGTRQTGSLPLSDPVRRRLQQKKTKNTAKTLPIFQFRERSTGLRFGKQFSWNFWRENFCTEPLRVQGATLTTHGNQRKLANIFWLFQKIGTKNFGAW